MQRQIELDFWTDRLQIVVHVIQMFLDSFSKSLS